MSLEELKEKLESEKGNILTTKSILEKGISSYYINKLIDNKVLEKKERGKYLVLIPLKEKRKNASLGSIQIQRFKYQVRHYNFDKSYEYLVKFYSLQTTDHSYEYIYVSLILLEQLLKGRKDFSLLKDFDKDISESYLSYLSPFKISVLEKNYEQALIDLYNIKKDGHSLDVNVLFILVKSVMKINNIPVKYENIGDFSEVDFYYENFKKELKSGNLESAKESLRKCMELDFTRKIPYKNELLILVKGLINLQENKIDFNEDKGIIYEGSYEEILIKAIHNKDFKTAFSKIGACTYQTTNTSYLLMKNILYKMYDFKKVKKNIVVEEKNDIAEEKNIAVEEQNIVAEKNIEDNIIEKENVLVEEEKAAPLISLLYSFIMNNNFKEAEELLDKSSEEGRLKDLCIALFEELSIVQNRYKYYNEVILDSDDLFSQVFEAIRRRDLYQARELLLRVIPSANAKKEFQIYLQLVNEILSQNQSMTQMQESEEKLKPFFNNSILSLDDVLNVKALLEEQIKLFGENKRDYHLLNIIEVIISASEIQINKNDFSSMPSEKRKPLDRLNEYLQNGEFLLAEELIDKTPNWKVFASDYSIFDIKMIKYLLKTMKLFMYKYTEKERETHELPKMSDEFYSLVKHRKYQEALQFYLEHEDLLYETENKDLIKNLIVLFYFQSEEGIKLYEEYLNAKEQSNRDLERIALLNYKEYLKINNIDDNYVPVLKK